MLVLSRVFGLLFILNFFSIPAAAILGSRINSYLQVAAGHHLWELITGLVLLFIWTATTAFHGYRLLQKEPVKYPHSMFLLILYCSMTLLLFGQLIPRIDFSSNDFSAYLTAYTFWAIPILQFYDLMALAPHREPERIQLVPAE